jgi:hypothetical protein
MIDFGSLRSKMADPSGGVSNLHPHEWGLLNVPLNGVISPYLGVAFIKGFRLSFKCD